MCAKSASSISAPSAALRSCETVPIESTIAPVISRPGSGSSFQNGSRCRREKGNAMLLVRVTGTMLRQ